MCKHGGVSQGLASLVRGAPSIFPKKDGSCSTLTLLASRPPIELGFPDVGEIALSCCRLLRKEVIQPHLPVQLPCYDFVPVTGPTLGRCLPEGLAHGLQALSASMT